MTPRPLLDGSTSSLADRAAIALNATTPAGERNPKTMAARMTLALWLAGEWTSTARVRAACVILEGVARAGRLSRKELAS